jgi:tetratricopeptide (TPR) repeat protein
MPARNRSRAPAPAAALFALALAPAAAGESSAPTFTRDVAPILLEHCAPCHRPGEAAPFSLLTYADAERRSRQIALVSASRFMPPWLPAPGPHELAGRRGLTAEAIDVLQRWHAAGAPAGEPADLPPAPRWSEGWQLGEPDLVVEMTAPFVLAADGEDVWRNFVMPIPVERPRWVRAVELRPGNKRVAHHAILRLDRTPASRRLDAADPEPGFGGMEMGRSLPPGGQFIGWTPGKLPFPGQQGVAWRAAPGTDLVLQIHLLPTGKPEEVRARVGLHFTDEPPTLFPSEITLYSDAIDIPADVARYVVEDRFEFPVAVELLGLYPHAHYLGKEMRIAARLPGGDETTLLHIPDWDFNWQDDYRYVRPVALPAGTTVVMRYTYDNSADNKRNPHVPPRRVRHGQRSTDEMASLGLQVLVRDPADRARLDEAQARAWLARVPDSWTHRNELGVALARQGRTAEAVQEYRHALTLEPDAAEARYNLGLAYTLSGRRDEAVAEIEHALRIEPGDAEAHNNLGHLRLAAGQTEAAIASFRRALAIAPYLEQAHYNLALALASRGALDQAERHYREAIALAPGFAGAHNNLGTVLQQQGRLDEAIAAYRTALAIREDQPLAQRNLGRALTERGRPREALPHLRRAVQLDPGDALARTSLAEALAAAGLR